MEKRNTATDEQRRALGMIFEIVSRAERMGLVRSRKKPDHWYTRATAVMDLEKVNEKTPLDFERWLAADDFNFMHDIAGIARHMDRETGRLEDGFCPRFCKR